MCLHVLRLPLAFAAILGLCLAHPTPARAELDCNVPAGYYQVVNLDSTGPVAFYSDPSSSSTLLGELQPGDVVQSDGTRGQHEDRAWQRVKVLQTDGWVMARHLWRTLPKTLAKTELPLAGHCGAYQPLWSMRWDEHKVSMSLYPGRYDFDVL